MSYESISSDYYRNADFRNRADICAREQGFIFTADGRPDIAALGRSVVAGDPASIDAVIAAVSTAPGAGDLNDDTVLLAQTQAVWPTVSAALFPQA